MSTGYHTRWTIPPVHREGSDYHAAGLRMALAEAVYARRAALGWTVAQLAATADLTVAEVERIEESGTDPTLDVIERLATAFGAVVLIDPASDHALTFETRAA